MEKLELWGIIPSQLIGAEVIVKRDDLLDKRSCANLVDQSLVMTLARLHMHDAIRHVRGCQFPDNASLDAAHESVLRLEDEVQVLPRELSTVPLAHVRVHVLKVEVQLVVKFRGNDLVVWQQVRVIITTQKS